MIPAVLTCKKCGREWPRLVEYWPREPTAPDGMRKTCLECRKQWKRDNHNYRARNEPGYREHHNERNRTNARRGGYEARRSQRRREIRTMTAEKSGVYLLFLQRSVVYIGRSRKMLERVNGHRRNGRPFDHAFYISASPDDSLWLESALIRAL